MKPQQRPVSIILFILFIAYGILSVYVFELRKKEITNTKYQYEKACEENNGVVIETRDLNCWSNSISGFIKI